MQGLLVDPNMPVTPEIPEIPQQPQMPPMGQMGGGMPPMGGQPPMPTGDELMQQGGMPQPQMGNMPTMNGMVSNVDDLAAIEQAGLLPTM